MKSITSLKRFYTIWFYLYFLAHNIFNVMTVNLEICGEMIVSGVDNALYNHNNNFNQHVAFIIQEIIPKTKNSQLFLSFIYQHWT